MATDKTTIKEWFKNGKKPDESQFAAWIDSYWHKEDEKIDLKAINGLENALNNKTEKVDFNSLSDSVQNHTSNQNIHITEEEKNKLSNLTENLDGYIKKGETALIVQLNLLKDENEDYYLNETTQTDLEQFLKKYRSTINLQLKTYNNDKEEYWYLTSISEKTDEENEYIDYKLTFLQIQSGEEKAINCESLVIDVKTLYEDDSIQDIQITRDTVSLAQDFDSNRYDTSKEDLEKGDPNLDYYTESGGISYYDPNKNIVSNLPGEATQGFGFVVGNDKNQAIQIIRDEITGKIYHRGLISEIEWSEWAEMGEGEEDKYLPLEGGTLSGNLIINNNSTTEQWIDNYDGIFFEGGNPHNGIGDACIYHNKDNGDLHISVERSTDSKLILSNVYYGGEYAAISLWDLTIEVWGNILPRYSSVRYGEHQNIGASDKRFYTFYGERGNFNNLIINGNNKTAEINTIKRDGDGTRFLADDGSYQAISNDDCIKKSRIQVVEEIPDLSTLEDGDIIIQL